jgi:hypothetical protein
MLGPGRQWNSQMGSPARSRPTMALPRQASSIRLTRSVRASLRITQQTE